MSEIDRKLAAQAAKGTPQSVLADSALQGVTVAFLSQTFKIAPQKVKMLLVNCPVKEYRRRGTQQTQNVYDLATAAAYLVEPKVKIEDILNQIKREDLPPAINTAFWDAQLKRQKWEENAGQLWRTETIRSTIGAMFQTMKFTIQLWADTIERQVGLTEEQRDLLNAMTDKLQETLFNSLKENAESAMTGPQLAELDVILKEAKEQPEVVWNPELKEAEDEDDFSDLL